MNPLLKKSVSYAIVFRLMEGLVFSPLMGLVGQLLKGRTVVDSTALIGFFLSPRGFSAALLAMTSLLLIRMIEQAGLSVLRAEEFGGRVRRPISALKFVLSRIVPLFRAAFRFIILILLMLTPFLIVTGIVARRLLSQHDINFYLAQRPTEFLVWGGVIGVLLLITLSVLIWSAVRWRWVVHVILFENKFGGAAFRRSAELTQGAKLHIALLWGAIAVLNLALGTLAAWIGRLILPLGVGLLGDSHLSLGILLGALLVLQALIGALIVMGGPIVEALIFTRWYFKRSGQTLTKDIDQTPVSSGYLVSLPVWAYALLMLIFVGLGSAVGGIWGTEALALDRPVVVIAHRAAMFDVPENSVPAIERAILDGAHVAEIDVQLSRDGVVVLAHDSDYSRVGGIAKKVSDLTWEEIKKIDLGTGLGPEYKGVRVPRLEDILKVAKDRISLNIEIKHYGAVDEILEKRVVDLIHQYGDVKQVEVQALEYESIMVVRRLDPAIKIGYLLSVNARDTDKLQVDFLSVQSDRVDARFLRKARRAGQRVYVWTVNQVDDMERMVDLGVDGLITDKSKIAAEFLQSRRTMSPRDKALARLRTWLAR